MTSDQLKMAELGFKVISSVVTQVMAIRAQAAQGDITNEEAIRRIEAIHNPPTDEILGPRPQEP